MGRKSETACAAVILSTITILPSIAIATDRCDALGFEIAQTTNAVVTRRSDRNILELKHPFVDDAGVDYCNSERPGFSASVNSPYPQTTFFDFIEALSPVVTKANGPQMRSAAKKCVRSALRDPDGLKTTTINRVELTCNVASGKSGFVTVLARQLPQS